MALWEASAALGAGSNAICKAQPVGALDQRGIHRPQGLDCDMGAFELQEGSAACSLPQTPPVLKSPANNAQSSTRNVSLDWAEVECAPKYQVRYGRVGQTLTLEQTPVSHFTTPELEKGVSYEWQARACRKRICGEWSDLRTFTIKP